MRIRYLYIAIFILFLSSNAGQSQELSITEPVRFLALGDSYTIGESVAPADRWPRQLFDSLANRGYEVDTLMIIAETGWRTDDLIRAIEYANPASDYNLVSLLIGVNNQFQRQSLETYVVEFEELLNTAIQLAGGRKSSVFIVSIPDYGYTPFGQRNQTGISQEIDEFNDANRNIAIFYGIKYYDITPVSRLGLSNPELVAGDGLHPSKEMYSEWVKIILEDINNPSTGSETSVHSPEKDNSITIYPNPALKRLFISIEDYDNSEFRVQLVDMTGRKVIDKTYISSRVELNLENTIPGLYLLRIKHKEKIITRKVMVQFGS